MSLMRIYRNLRDSDRRVGGRDIQNTDKGGAGKQWIKNLQ